LLRHLRGILRTDDVPCAVSSEWRRPDNACLRVASSTVLLVFTPHCAQCASRHIDIASHCLSLELKARADVSRFSNRMRHHVR
jgi:hypothetical protein